MSKVVSFESGAEKAKKGFKIATRAVISTIGPKGKNVFLADPTLPRFTNDGASIANKIVLEDSEEDAGAWVVRSATAKTADEVGDQTTTTATIMDALFDEIEKRSESAVEIKNSLLAVLPEIEKEIQKASHKTTLKDVKHIATVSSENEELAKLITEIFEKKGVDAQINISDSETVHSYIRMADGYEAKVGMMSPYLVTDVQKMRAEYKDVPVLVTHKKIDSITQLLPVYQKLSEKNITKLVIVCEDIDHIAALGAIIDNKRRGTFSTLVIRATGELLDDIAAVVGATPVSEHTSVDFADEDILKKLGKASSVISTPNSVTTQGRSIFVGKSARAKEHAQMLENQSKEVTNSFEKGAIEKRVAKLRSGVAELKLGALSEQQLGYLRDKADDAVKAVKSALEEGYVEGGGMTLHRIGTNLSEKTIGHVLLKKALQAPLKKIVENAGKDYSEIVLNLKDKGYDAKDDEYKDLIKAGIIDPAKGARVAVESAVSSVAEFIVTGSFITEIYYNSLNPDQREKRS